MSRTQPLAAERIPPQSDRAIALWLLACCAMIFLMALIGAITRLTESGLSIMEWAPITGTLPPLSQAEWERIFAIYQQIPEFTEDNPGMTLAEFKTIFWWEYIHRLWGRLIGVVFLLPFLWFLVRGRIRRPLVPHLAAMFVLGGLQGLVGWYMVASGFADRTDVSQYRLTAHLMFALLIYGYILWVAVGLLLPENAQAGADDRRLRSSLVAFLALVTITLASGGFVAGLNAGFIYNEFPLMDGRLVPDGYGDLSPFVLNLFENVAAVQFDHRALAIATLAVALYLWLRAKGRDLSRPMARALDLVLLAALAQVGLGIATLILVVPTTLAVLHQAGGILLLTAALWALRLAYPPARSWT